MSTYETSTTVQEQGRGLVAGVPFAPGTEVHVAISAQAGSDEEMARSEDEAWAAARQRMRELLGGAKGFRNSPRIPREELYERGRLP
jgi:hypothetical protein